MQYKFLFIFFLIISCAQNSYQSINKKESFSSKGLAYIYNEDDYNNEIIKKELNNNSFEIAHKSLRPGTLLKVINLYTNDEIVLKNTKRIDYPDFYKILITKPVADKINLQRNLPFVEIFEIKKNKSFIAKKTKIYEEEEKIHSNAPVEKVKIDNISKNKTPIKKIKNLQGVKIHIIIGEFYSKESVNLLKRRINRDLTGYNSKKLFTKTINTNKIRLLSGPYKSINLMKNDYILLKNFGFEELDININE